MAGLASDAELLILDEPTSGLDPLMETVFQQLIFEVKEQGRTVLLSSHILAEVEKTLRPGHDHPAGQSGSDRDPR